MTEYLPFLSSFLSFPHTMWSFFDLIDMLKCQYREGRYFHCLLSLRSLLKTLMVFQISCCFYLTITYKTITNNKSFLGCSILWTRAILCSQGQFSFLIYPLEQNCRCWRYFANEKILWKTLKIRLGKIMDYTDVLNHLHLLGDPKCLHIRS